MRWPRSAALIAALIAAAPARAQMPDPSAMSGIPRPDGTVPAGTLVVRVIRGDFAHPMVDAEVELEGAGGKRSGKVGADGRATFSGLTGGTTYRVSSSVDKETVRSQDIPMPGEVGVKVMLVFRRDPASEGARATGPGKADAAPGPSAGTSSADLGQLSINRKSHIILEVKDEGVEVVENYFVQNAAAVPVDPGPAGVVFTLPDAAQGAQLVGERPAGLTLAQNRALLAGPIAPGETALSVAFVLPLREATAELRQALPLRMEQLVAITSDFPGLEVKGPSLTTTMRELAGRKFVIINGGPIDKDGLVQVTLVGLPHRSPIAAYLAVLVAALVALWGLWAGFGAGSGGADGHSRLLADKKQLLDELAALERSKAGTAKAEAKHARRAGELTEKLERVMRELDDFAE